mmetsp:Transcript_1096/g.4669  ORF Transcript_1096/g.4669 Transcript_1096/m.4669 type:complete len:203 (+) Transcript_1096:1191-1799(+)
MQGRPRPRSSRKSIATLLTKGVATRWSLRRRRTVTSLLSVVGRALAKRRAARGDPRRWISTEAERQSMSCCCRSLTRSRTRATRHLTKARERRDHLGRAWRVHRAGVARGVARSGMPPWCCVRCWARTGRTQLTPSGALGSSTPSGRSSFVPCVSRDGAAAPPPMTRPRRRTCMKARSPVGASAAQRGVKPSPGGNRSLWVR